MAAPAPGTLNPTNLGITSTSLFAAFAVLGTRQDNADAARLAELKGEPPPEPGKPLDYFDPADVEAFLSRERG